MKHTPGGKLSLAMNPTMETKKPRKMGGPKAKMAALLLLSATALVATLALTEGEFGLVVPARKREASEIAVDAAIGATVEPLDRATAESLGIAPRDQGLVITSLGRNGPAARAGIMTGDVIERVGTAPIASLDDAAGALKGTQAPEIILMLNRHGRYVNVRLPIRSGPERPGLATQGGER
jgi:S1-C subfamily serine protease